MTIHVLKTWPVYYHDLLIGRKNFEVRLNDRNYQIGDVLDLQEYDPIKNSYTSRHLFRRVTYILKGFEGLAYGWVVMGIEAC